MTVKHGEMEEAHLSNIIGPPGQADGACDSNLSDSGGVRKEHGSRSWGWLLSGVICVNILILGCTLVSSSVYNNVGISTRDLQAFLIVIVLLTAIWMIYYIVYMGRQENAVVYKDSHAGPVWLRGGLALFGLLSMIMNIFKIASYIGYLHCDSAVKVAYPAVQFVFVVLQTYFLWVHAKDCVQIQKNITRCGLMLTMSTNLVVWMTAVTEESIHQTTTPDYDYDNVTKISGRSMYINRASYGEDKCKCSQASCRIFKDAYYYLYPFNIEYSLFASAMAYVLWKNVGRVVDDHGHKQHSFSFRLKDVFIGSIAGVLLVMAGLATFIVYEMVMQSKSSNEAQKDNAVMMYFIMNIVILTLMSVSSMIGCAIFKVDHREHVSEKNPTRNLDVGLLVGTSMGQFIISYFSIVAMVATGAKGHLNGLNLAGSILMVVQLGLQNIFIIVGLHREPFHEVEPEATVVANEYVLKSEKEVSELEGSDLDKRPRPAPPAHNLHPHHTAEHRHKLLWKRRVLKEVSTFLLMGNIILWIMPAFGARPQFDHDTETQFYKFNMWAAIVNIGLPFGIFYRMHAVASLFEVFANS